MYIKQSELFAGTSMDFWNVHKKGEVLFSEKDPAKFFFILLNGRVELSVGKPKQAVYNATRNGEAFGWSSLIGGDVYSASAECIEPTKLLKTNSDKLSRVLEADPDNGIIFFKQLAATLGNRLLETYKLVTPPKDE